MKKPKQTIIYIIYTEHYGENDLVFDSQFKFLDAWSCNDATWRGEYFNGFMEKLGIKVLNSFPEGVDSEKMIIDALVEEYGEEARPE